MCACVCVHMYVRMWYVCMCLCSGIPQGKLIKRQQLPKNELGETWHWQDLNLGIDVTFYGKVFHIFDCDKWTGVSVERKGGECRDFSSQYRNDIRTYVHKVVWCNCLTCLEKYFSSSCRANEGGLIVEMFYCQPLPHVLLPELLKIYVRNSPTGLLP